MNRLFFFLIFLSFTTLGHGQFFKKKNRNKKDSKKEQSSKPRFDQSPNAYVPYTPDEKNPTSDVKYSKKKRKRKRKRKSAYSQYSFTMEKKVEEFEERMIANAKARKKMQRKMLRPQYSDPSYFGHKRKPKKRKVGKRKFCKECKIVH